MKSRNVILIVSIVFLFVSLSFSSFSLISAQTTSSGNYSLDTIHSSGGTEVTSSDFDTKTVIGTITGKTSSVDFGTSLGFFSGISYNNPPNNPSPVLKSSEGTNYTDENLECSSLIEDPDEDKLDAYVRWYKNGNLFDERAYENGYSSGTNFQAVLSSSETAAGDVWKCGLRIYDGNEFSDWVNSSELTVGKTPELPPPGPRPGPRPGPTPPENVTEEGKFEVEPGLMKFTLKRGNAVRKKFTVRNIGNTSLKINVDKTYLDFLRVFDKEEFTLEPNETKTVSADFYVEKDTVPDVYAGQINVHGNNNQTETINVIIIVEEKKPLFDVIINIKDKRVIKGDKVTADISLINMGDLRHFDVLFRYAIKDLKGNIITYKKESLAIDKELELTRSLKVPEETEEGQYLFYANVRYDDISASGTETFRVVESVLPMWAYYIIGFVLLILILILIILIYRKYKEYQQKKKVFEEV